MTAVEFFLSWDRFNKIKDLFLAKLGSFLFLFANFSTQLMLPH